MSYKRSHRQGAVLGAALMFHLKRTVNFTSSKVPTSLQVKFRRLLKSNSHFASSQTRKAGDRFMCHVSYPGCTSSLARLHGRSCGSTIVAYLFRNPYSYTFGSMRRARCFIAARRLASRLAVHIHAILSPFQIFNFSTSRAVEARMTSGSARLTVRGGRSGLSTRASSVR